LKVIVDASNVASFEKDKGSKAKLDYILTAVEALEDRGDDFTIIADASLKHDIDDKEKYTKLVDKGIIEEVEAGNNADHFILKLAQEEKSKILSNDLFREFSDEFQDINNMRIPFSFEDGKITMGEFQKPKKVKNILQKLCDGILVEVENKRYETYTGKDGVEFSPLNIAKESIIRMDKANQSSVENKLEGIFSKIPMFGKVMDMIDDVETSAPYVIFVLVNPKDYKEAVKNAGNISVTIGDRLHLMKNPLIAVRNDLYMRPGHFELNILYADEVLDDSPFNIDIIINVHDESFIKKNSRNIASTIAGRIGTWKFPIVSVKPNLILEKPGDFDIYLDKEKKSNLDIIK
jgi:hypothetical protein